MNDSYTNSNTEFKAMRDASGAALEDYSKVKILRLSELKEILGLSRSTIYAMMNESATQYDPKFPTQIRIGVSSSGRGSVGWLAHEVYEYIGHCTFRSRSAKNVNLEGLS